MLKKGCQTFELSQTNHLPVLAGSQCTCHCVVGKVLEAHSLMFCVWSLPCLQTLPHPLALQGHLSQRDGGNTKEPWSITVGVTQIVFLSQRSLMLAFPQNFVICLHVVHVGPERVTMAISIAMQASCPPQGHLKEVFEPTP